MNATDRRIRRSIGVLLYNNYPNDSRVRRQAEALVAAGYSVDVIALCSYPDRKQYTMEGVTVYQVPLGKKRGGAGRYFLQYGYFFLLATWKISFLFLKKRYSVIHVNNMPNFIVFCALLPKLFGTKLILDIHDPFPELFAITSGSGKHGLLRKLLQIEERASAWFADHVIATTDLILEAMAARGIPREKMSVVINAPDERIFRRSDNRSGPTEEKKGFRVLYAGTVTARYGLDNIVRALAIARGDIPGLEFRIIGAGDYLEKLQELTAELGMDDIVHMYPIRPVEEIPHEYIEADAVLWFAERNEFIDIIMCVKVLEALAMGLPVISTRTRCHAHYFPDGQVGFVNDLHPEKLASAVTDLYRNYASRLPSQEDTRAFIARFGWQHEQRRYFDVIERLIAGAAAETVAAEREK